MTRVLAIETSCDETSVAIVKNRQVLSNIVKSQINIHSFYGGVVPEVASRQHLEIINQAIASALREADLDWPDIDGRDEIEDISIRLTDHKKKKNYYNIAPAISPDGSKIAILEDKSGFANITLIDAIDGKYIKNQYPSGQLYSMTFVYSNPSPENV